MLDVLNTACAMGVGVIRGSAMADAMFTKPINTTAIGAAI
jgi:hypothetical protein